MLDFRHTVAAAVVLVAMTASASASDQEGRFAVKGPGLTTCQDLIEPSRYSQREATLLLGGWLLGFISAQNQHLDDTYDVAPWVSDQSLYRLVRNHCKNRPNDRLASVALQLTKFFTPQRLTSESKIIMVGGATQKVRIYEEVLRRVQEELKQQGHYKGVIDGMFGPGSEEALKSYQTAKGIEATGLPDQPTLFSMFADDLREASGGEN